MQLIPPLRDREETKKWQGVDQIQPVWPAVCAKVSSCIGLVALVTVGVVVAITYAGVRTDQAIASKLSTASLINVTIGGGGGGNGTGINCWDLDEDGTCDLGTEDTNNDGICSVLDCRGEDGTDGVNGTNGSNGVNGADGQDGTHCWDLNTNGVCDLGTEDTNSDGICSVLDCRGTNGTAGGNTSSICESGCETLSVGALNVTTGNNWFNGTTTLQNVVVAGDFQTLGGDIDIEAGTVAIAGTIFLSGSVTAYAPVVISGQLSASGATVLNRLNITTGNNWLNGTTTIQNLVITGSTSLGSSLVLPSLNITTGDNWFNGTTTLETLVCNTVSSSGSITGGSLHTSGLIVGNILTISSSISAASLTASGSIVGNNINATTGPNFFNGNTTLQNLTVVQKAWVSTLDASGAITAASLNTGSGAIQTTGSGSFGAITGTSVNAGSGTIQTTGTGSFGAITGTSLNVGSGALTAGAVSCSSVNSGSGTIQTTGTGSFGAITGTSLNIGSGALMAGAVGCTSVNAGSGTIQTTGSGSFGAITGTSLNAGSGTIQTTGSGSFGALTSTSVNAGSGTIQTTGSGSFGALTSTSLNAGSGTVQTTGAGLFGRINVTSGHNWINGTSTLQNLTVTSISSLQATTCTTLDASGAITGASLNTGSGAIQTTGSGSFGALTSTSLNAGSGTIQTTGTGSFGAVTCTSVNSGSGTVQTSGTVSAGALTVSGATVLNRLNVTTGNNWINGTTTVQNLVITGTTSIGTGIVLPSLNITTGHNWFNGTSTLQALTVTGSSSLQATSCTTLDASGAITGASLNTGSGAIQTTGSGSFGALTSTSLNAGSGTVQTSGTGSFGAITGTSLNVGSGALTAGAVSCSSVNSGSGTIQTTGTGSFGAITGTSLNVGSGALTAGAVTCSSVNSGSGTIQTTGSGSFGAITGTSLNAGSGTIQTTGAGRFGSLNVTSGHNWINGTSTLQNLTVTSLTSLQATTCTTLDASGAITGASLNVGSGALTAGAVTCSSVNSGSGTIQTTGTGSFGAITGTSLNVGSGGITGGAVSCSSVNSGSGTIQTTGSGSFGAITGTSLNVGSGALTAGAVTCSSVNSGSGTIQTTGSGSFGALTSTSLNAGSGTIQTTGSGSFGAITGTSMNAGSGTVQTTGAGLFGRINVTAGHNWINGTSTLQNLTVTSISSLQATTCTTLDASGAITGASLNVGAGALTAGAVSCSSVNSGSGTIQTTGGGSFGAITGTSLNVGSGAITAGAVGCSSVNAGSGTIQTTGSGSFGAITGTSLNAGSGTIQTTGSGSFGAITGTSLNAGSGTIQTTGSGVFGPLMATSLDAGSGYISTSGILQGSYLKITSPTAVVGSSAVTFPPYTITAVDTLYPSVYVTGGLTTRGGLQHDGDAGILHRINVWRNSTGSDLVYNTSFPAWDFFADVNLYDKFVVRRAPSGSSVASWSELFRVGTLGGYFANNLGIGVPASNNIGLSATPSLRQSISSNASHYGAYLQPVLGALINARVPLVSSVYVDTNLGTNIGTVDAAYGVYISEGSTNATVTAGYGLYVKHPAFGTSKTTAYFENTVTVGGTLTTGAVDSGSGTIQTTGKVTANSLGVGVTSPSYTVHVSSATYPSMFLTSTHSLSKTAVGIQYNSNNGVYLRFNAWRNSSGIDVLVNTSLPAWDIGIGDDLFFVRRSASGATAASFSNLLHMTSTGTLGLGADPGSNTGLSLANALSTASAATDLYGLINQRTYTYNSGSTSSFATAFYGSCNTVVNSGASLSYASNMVLAGPTNGGAGSVTNARTLRVTVPTIGSTSNVAIHTDNLVVGSSYSATSPPSNGAIFEGNVAIGATSPSAPLHVYRAAASGVDTELRVENGGSGGSTIRFLVGNSGSGEPKQFRIYDGTANRFGITSGGDVVLQPSSGNMGVGSTTASVKLHVSSNGEVFRMQGTDHCYMSFYPDGASTRKGYIGYSGAADDGLSIVNENSGANLVISQTGAGYIVFANNGNNRVYVNPSGHVQPAATNTYQMGVSGSVWTDIYCANTVIQTSDAVLKTDITNTSLGLDFIQRLRPVTFRFKNYTRIEQRTIEGTNETENVTIQVTHKRYHEGLIAQEVAQVLRDVNVSPGNAAMYIDPAVTGDEGNKGLRYGELISPLIKAVQELSHLTPPKWAPGAPTSSVSPCTPGAVQYTETYLFICVSVDRWSRLALEQSW